MSEFPDRVGQIVKLVGSVTELSARSNISRRSLGNYMAGEGEPTRTKLIALQQASGCAIKWLVTGEGPMFEPACHKQAPILVDAFVPSDDARGDAPSPASSDSAGHGPESGLAFTQPFLDQLDYLLDDQQVGVFRITKDVLATGFAVGDTVLYERLGSRLDDAQLLLNGLMVVEIDDVSTIAYVQQRPGKIYKVAASEHQDAFESPRSKSFEIVGRVNWHGHAV